jgi:hypothetical protein
MRNFQFPTAIAPRRQGWGTAGGKNRSIAIIVTRCKLKTGKVLGGVGGEFGSGGGDALARSTPRLACRGRDDPAC